MSKRARVGEIESTVSNEEIRLNSISFLDLPNEILIIICRFLTFHEVCTSLRLACLKLNEISSHVLNTDFLKIEARIRKDMELAESDRLQTVNNLADSKPACKAYEGMEFIRSEYSITKALLWRYLSLSSPRCVMFGGKALDGVVGVLEAGFDSRTKAQVDGVLEELRRFQLHFESVVERDFNFDWTVSSSKLLDILDCIQDKFDEGLKVVDEESLNREKGTYTLRCKYIIPRACFTCLSPSPDQTAFNKRHTLMSRCIRRLVSKHNTYSLEFYHWRKQVVTYREFWMKAASIYHTGFHKQTFTYYLCMSPRAYSSRFPTLEAPQGVDEGEVEEEGDGDDEEGEEREEEDLEVGQLWRVVQGSRMDLEFRVELECSLWDAPSSASFDPALRPRCPPPDPLQRPFLFKLDVFCPSSKDSRLPFLFKWRPHRLRTTETT